MQQNLRLQDAAKYRVIANYSGEFRRQWLSKTEMKVKGRVVKTAQVL